MFFQQAKNYYRGRTARPRLIVIHTAEALEKNNTAENIIKYFAGSQAPKASCHYAIDNDSIAQGVREEDTAFAAPGANHDGIQIEHAGYARQTLTEWNDPFSQAMLELSAKLTADLCRRWNIPPVHVTGETLRTGRGICGHVDVNRVYHQSTHTDPGDYFPWEQYIQKVKQHLGTTPAPAFDVEQAARAVIAGKYGNGAQRRAALGANYAAVQARVNQILTGQTPAPAFDVEQAARAVIAGKYGNGAQRRAALGANYAAVQARVNQILGA